MLSESRLIVGLGNPGRDYEYTRHNLGFLTVRRLAQKLKLKFGLSSLTNGMTAEGASAGCQVCLLMPLTYMNHSGVAAGRMMVQNGLRPQDVLVVCDDVALKFGQIRLRAKGSDGGHNGLASVIQHLKTDQFARLRMGVGRHAGQKDVVDYVLEEFSKKERARLDDFIDEAVACCLMYVQDGITKAMEQYNRKT